MYLNPSWYCYMNYISLCVDYPVCGLDSVYIIISSLLCFIVVVKTTMCFFSASSEARDCEQLGGGGAT